MLVPKAKRHVPTDLSRYPLLPFCWPSRPRKTYFNRVKQRATRNQRRRTDGRAPTLKNGLSASLRDSQQARAEHAFTYLGKLLHEVPPERPGQVNRSIGLLERNAQHRSQELSSLW